MSGALFQPRQFHFLFYLLQGFFRRSIQQKIQYRPCTKNQQCAIQRINRNRCQYCRLKKCISVGMSRDGESICCPSLNTPAPAGASFSRTKLLLREVNQLVPAAQSVDLKTTIGRNKCEQMRPGQGTAFSCFQRLSGGDGPVVANTQIKSTAGGGRGTFTPKMVSGSSGSGGGHGNVLIGRGQTRKVSVR